MCAILALLFIVVPAIEIALLIQVGGTIGVIPTFGVIVLTGILGAALARHQGVAAVRRVSSAIQSGREVGTSLVEGALVLVAGVLMLTPGFITDAIGFLLLVPPLRKRAGGAIASRVAKRSHTVVFSPQGPHGRVDDDDQDSDPPPPGVIDV